MRPELARIVAGMLVRVFAGVLLSGVVLAAAVLPAQGPIVPRPTAPEKAPPETRPLRDREVPVTLDGCVRGAQLRVDEEPSTTTKILGVRLFSLEGPRELMRQLQKEHDGHWDQISGVVVIPAGDDTEILTKELGKRTRVVAGDTSKASERRTLRLKVQSLEHLGTRC